VLSAGWDWAQVDLGWRDHWFSPFTDSAMVTSTESPTMPGVTISNYDPFTGLGLQYELFLARVSHHNNIELPNGTVTEGYPKFLGTRFGIEPAHSGWALSVNRIMFYGGGEAGGQTAADLFRAYITPQAAQTTKSGTPVLGKQQASVTSRFIYPGRIPFSLYFEYGGNDYSGSRFSFSKPSLSVGLQFPRLGPFDLTDEVSEWQPSWYTKTPGSDTTGYGDGITNYLRVTGHWFGDQRQFGDAVPGHSNMLRIGLEPVFSGRLELTLRTLVNDGRWSTYAGSGTGNYVPEYMGTLMYSHPWKDYVIGSQIDYGRDVFGQHYTRVAAFLRYGDALRFDAGDGAESASPARPEGAEVHVDVGAAASRVVADITSDTPRTYSGTGYGPHVTVGARRAVTEHQDLGAALEADDVHGASLLSARIIDYRYRFGNPLALNLYLGAARYAAPTPAYGFYFGAGLQWRDIVPKWDIGADYRYANKVDRVRYLPSDPQGGYRPDAYYDISVVTLYVSRKF
jgi:hypothetical protein